VRGVRDVVGTVGTAAAVVSRRRRRRGATGATAAQEGRSLPPQKRFQMRGYQGEVVGLAKRLGGVGCGHGTAVSRLDVLAPSMAPGAGEGAVHPRDEGTG